MSMTVHVDEGAPAPDAITLEDEELEEVIAPKLAGNHNETLVGDEVGLNAEEEAGLRGGAGQQMISTNSKWR